MVRWDDTIHGADLRGRVARGEVHLDDLAPDTLFNITAAHYPETIGEGQHARSTVIQRMRRLLLRIRAELDQQGARRRAAGRGKKILFLFAETSFLIHLLFRAPQRETQEKRKPPKKKPKLALATSTK